MNNIEPKEFILNYEWNNDDEHHCFRECNGFVIKVDYNADKYLIEGLEGFGDCTDEIGRIETKQDLVNFLEDSFDQVSEEYTNEIDDLIKKLKEEIEEEKAKAKEIETISAKVYITMPKEYLQEFAKRKDITDFLPSNEYLICAMIEDALDGKGFDMVNACGEII